MISICVNAGRLFRPETVSGEDPLLGSEIRCLVDCGGENDNGEDTDNDSEDTLDDKDVSPPMVAAVLPNRVQACSEKTSKAVVPVRLREF